LAPTDNFREALPDAETKEPDVEGSVTANWRVLAATAPRKKAPTPARHQPKPKDSAICAVSDVGTKETD
jgi:hypothetical protein